ncbi:hypothetical protein JCM31185_00250 [Furfurilactobacillus curtus]|uniref:Uncharacterized protein n=1 Tax=Furfurilactobacillus curtus TaxID=1746200 RepID=A0ABQ5JNQ3_9LACO
MFLGRMSVIVSQKDYDWMIKFFESEDPEDGYDFYAPWVLANLINKARFEDIKND